MSKSACNRIDETGNRYGRLLVLSYASTAGKQSVWLCRCDCGREAKVRGGDLRRKDDRAIRMCSHCGKQASKTHGHAGVYSLTYSSWHSMLTRVRREPRYQRLGVCERWRTFANFLADMGERPSKSHSIERLNGNLGYFPLNCRWATAGEQQRNTSKNVWIEIDGEWAILAEWRKKLGVSLYTYYARRKRGMSPQEALLGEHFGLAWGEHSGLATEEAMYAEQAATLSSSDWEDVNTGQRGI